MLPRGMLKQVQHDERKVWQCAAPYNPKGGFGRSAASENACCMAGVHWRNPRGNSRLPPLPWVGRMAEAPLVRRGKVRWAVRQYPPRCTTAC